MAVIIQIYGGYIPMYGDDLRYITIFLRTAPTTNAPARDLPPWFGDWSRSGSFVQIYQIPWPQFLTDWKERVALALVSWTLELGGGTGAKVRAGCGLRRKEP